MIRKLTFALATLGALGAFALMPTAANATWYGNGWYGYGKPYYSYGYYPRFRSFGPRYFYGGKFRGWRYGWNRYY